MDGDLSESILDGVNTHRKRKKQSRKERLNLNLSCHDSSSDSVREPFPSHLPFTLLRRPQSSSGRRCGDAQADQTQTCSADMEGSRRPQVSLFSTSKSTSSNFSHHQKSIWLRDVENEARKIWEMGKSFGASAVGDEEIIVSKLLSMEHRNAQEAGDLAVAKPRGEQAGDQ